MKTKSNKKNNDKSKEFQPKDLSDIENPTRMDVLNVILHNSRSLNPVLFTGASITLLVILLIFGKIIVASAFLSGVGYTAGRIVRRIRRKKECSI